MNLYVNRDQAVKHIYAGSQKIWKVYKGSSPVWQLNKVNFKDWNASVLKYEEVVSGNPATAPGDPAREGYEFIGWSPSSFSSITSDIDIVAQYEQAQIVDVNSVLVTNVANDSKWTINAQNKSYGYMYWTGSDLPVWQTSYGLVFDNESYLGQGLKNASGTATGYNGTSRSFTTGGRSGIALNSLTPLSNVLCTKVKLSPYCVVYAGASGSYITNQWYYDDVSPRQYAMPDNSGHVQLGYSCYSRGNTFRVQMTVVDQAGTHTFPKDRTAASALNGWSSSIPAPETLIFDFAETLKTSGLKKDARTTKIEFLEGTSTSSMVPAIVNAVCVYQDTINV